jgi:hypothetical protein
MTPFAFSKVATVMDRRSDGQVDALPGCLRVARTMLVCPLASVMTYHMPGVAR